MKAISGREFERLLERHGWQLKRIHGSHHIYAKRGNPARISAPIHGNTPLKVGLQKYLMKVAEITEEDL